MRKIAKTMFARCAFIALVLFASGPVAGAGTTQKAVQAGGTTAALLLPAKPRASIILLIGGPGHVDVDADGNIGRGEGNQLARTRAAYAARGFAVLVPDAGYDLAALVTYMAAIKRPVAVAATSRGTQRAASGIAAGARPDRLILTSGFLSAQSGDGESVMDILGSPAALPPTLVIHHREDGCSKTSPAGVAPFIAWAQGKARVTWLSGGTSDGDPCQAEAHHGFAGIDGQVVSAISGFVR